VSRAAMKQAIQVMGGRVGSTEMDVAKAIAAREA
jgi:hypothetical protein